MDTEPFFFASVRTEARNFVKNNKVMYLILIKDRMKYQNKPNHSRSKGGNKLLSISLNIFLFQIPTVNTTINTRYFQTLITLTFAIKK